jgi:hypothetical protein
MKTIIKKILRESKDDDDKKFISDFEKKKVLIKKTLPVVVKYLTKVLKEYDLYDISTDEIGVAYGSTVYYNDVTGERETFRSVIPKITLRFINLTHIEKLDVRRKVYNYIEDILGINIKSYGIPLDIKFINLVEVEF